MFRISYVQEESRFWPQERIKKIMEFIKGVTHGKVEFRPDPQRNGEEMCFVEASPEAEEAMKVALRQSEYNGCGLAVHGMGKFDPDCNILTFKFPTGKDAQSFLVWLDNSGEQGFYDSEEFAGDFDGSHLHFRYNDPGGNMIPVVRLKEGEKG